MTQTVRGVALIVSLALCLSLGGISSVPAHPSVNSSVVVRTWNQLALNTARVKVLSDAQASRLYAMVNVAIYDAVNGIASRRGSQDRDPALVPPDGAPPQGDLVAAAASAAHAVLVALYPDLSAQFDAQLATDLAGLGRTGPVTAG